MQILLVILILYYSILLQSQVSPRKSFCVLVQPFHTSFSSVLSQRNTLQPQPKSTVRFMTQSACGYTSMEGTSPCFARYGLFYDTMKRSHCASIHHALCPCVVYKQRGNKQRREACMYGVHTQTHNDYNPLRQVLFRATAT